MSLKRDLLRHVKQITLTNIDKPHVFIFNSEMITIEDARYVLDTLGKSGVNATVLLVKGDVRQAVAVASVVDGEIKEITDEEVQKNA